MYICAAGPAINISIGDYTMKRLVLTMLLITSGIASAGVDHQVVVEAPNKSTAAIIKAAQMAIGSVDNKVVTSDSIVFKAQTYCVKGSGFFAVKIPMRSDVIVEAKDQRFRVTFQDAYFPETGGIPLSSHSPDSDTRALCIAGFNSFVQGISQRVLSYSDF